jgi:hypothetical protein
MDKYSIEYLNIFPGSNLWWELATLVTILVLGHWLVGRASGFSAGHGRDVEMQAFSRVLSRGIRTAVA